MKIEWQCLECGDHGLKVVGFETMDDRAWLSVKAEHNRRNPGCTDPHNDGLRARALTNEEIDARLRAG
jgi:hypothetical protein